MLIDLFYALYQLAFLGFVVALVKHQRYAWLFLMLSCLLKIATMQDFSNINLGYLHYYLPEIEMIIISMIGYVSYSVDSQKNNFICNSDVYIFSSILFTCSCCLRSTYYSNFYFIRCAHSRV